MEPKEIEKLKSKLMQLTKSGCKIKNDTYGIDGRIIGIGFKPLWANASDSKIDKVEFEFVDSAGRIRPFFLYNIVGFEVVSSDGERDEDSKNVNFDIHIFSPSKARTEEPYDKIRIEFISH